MKNKKPNQSLNVDIGVRSESANARLAWRAFDGDDSFENFTVTVRQNDEERNFEFGACVVWGLRKMTQFFSDDSQSTRGLGFRNPDIRYCDWFRQGSDLRLVIRFEERGEEVEFWFRAPVLEIDRTFIATYDGEG